MIHRVLAILRRYDPVLLVAVVASVLTVFVADVLLLERKYDVFRGGFLQAHPIVGVSNAVPFLGVVLLFELLYFFAWAGAWGASCRWLEIGPRLAAYHFLGAVAGVNLVVIAARYQIFSYFSDFMDFAVMKNLAGGSLSAALAYGLGEGRLYGLVVGAAFCLYVAGHFYVARRLGPASRRDLRDSASFYAATCGACVLGLPLLVLAVNQGDDYRTHLNRMTAYSSPRDLFDVITDFDRDGYGLFGWWPDPAPFDPSVYPNALDIPGDGIDQDGLAGDFENRPRPTLNAVFAARKPHLVVVVLERAGADVIEAEVGGQPVVPVIRRLADRGSVARSYYSERAGRERA